MKLLQYRFKENDFKESSYVGCELESFFSKVGDLELVGISVDGDAHEGVRRRRLGPQEISTVIARSFEQSYAVKAIDYEKAASIKSLNSCRFLVFEDDGLLRMCYASEDDVLCFSKISPQVSVVSQLLVETDLFDFL